MRALELRLLALAALGLVAACGGSADTTLGDGGPHGGSGGSSDTSDGGTSATMPPTLFKSASDGGTFGASPGTALPRGDGGCGPEPVFDPPPASAACWDCMVKGCGPQFAACGSDCGCQGALGDEATCVNAGDARNCLLDGNGSGNDTLNALQLCLAESSNECCGTAPTTAPGMCVQTGSGVGGALGGGGCTTNVAETCSGEDFQVVCSCPEGTCVCFDDMDTRVVNFDSCSTCSSGLGPNPADLYTACGFPH
jgi:hypothetical protein